MDKRREIELYIHIPFCLRKCKYCDFLSAPASRQVQNAYMEALLREIEECIENRGIVSSIFIGGGTPSLVEPVWMERLMDSIRRVFQLSRDAEITMEMNPATVTLEGLKRYRSAGINRLSLGLQSARDEELSLLGRIHTYEQFLETYEMVRQAGFTNVNVDLMSALPGQSVSDWEYSLHSVASLNPKPEHISAYSLIVEENTPFYESMKKGEWSLPDEDSDREMYHRTAVILAEYGYEQYEISNYALPGKACRHNLGYWTRKDYLGFGIGAASLYEHKRFRNTDSLESYLQNPIRNRVEYQELSTEDEMEETMFLGLRLTEGLDMDAFYDSFGVTVESVYSKPLSDNMEKGLLIQNGRKLALTALGRDVSNYVSAEFLLGD